VRLFKSASDGREVKVAVVESIGEGEQRCGLGVVRACTGSSLGGDGEEWGSVCCVAPGEGCRGSGVAVVGVWELSWGGCSVVGDLSGAGAVILFRTFQRFCPLSVRSSQYSGVGFRYVDLCFGGSFAAVPCSAYQFALSLLDNSSQCSGCGG
jgi:hypothetical protein